jgi:hypothetical protein
MARILGEAGRYVSEQATKRQHRMLALGIGGMAVIGVILGLILRASFPWVTLPPLNGLFSTIGLLLLVWLVQRWMFRRFDELEKERNAMRSGAAGETSVGFILSKLPEEFCVLNDVSTSGGNLDHVVIGPTGVFVIETKNCRGLVEADGKGELMLNRKPAERRHVNRLVGRMMGTKEKIRVLAPGLDPFFHAVMVFTSAYVDAKFGSTGKVHCVRESQVSGYIVDWKPMQRLSATDVTTLANAFASLARMDPAFGLKMDGPGQVSAISSVVCSIRPKFEKRSATGMISR